MNPDNLSYNPINHSPAINMMNPHVTLSGLSDKVRVSYEPIRKVVELTRAEYDLIADTSLALPRAVKFIKAQYGLCLYDAKSVVDTARGNRR
jgi:hypothetical protein